MKCLKRKKRLLSILCLLCLFIIPNITLATSPSSNIIYEGIDVSNWQGYIDYSQVKESGIEIVYIKASQGNDYVDPYFKINYRNAKANGLKVGLYHYVTARNTEQAIQQADFFANVIASTSPDCKVAMDFESFGDLSVLEINEIASTFLETLSQKIDKDVIIYSDVSNARTVFSRELAAEYPLWVAEYGVSAPGETNWNTWEGFQYTSTGRLPGIEGYVDRNQFTETILLDDLNEIPSMPDTEQPFEEITYVVKRGDTLFRIARQYGTTVGELAQINQIRNPNLIYPGQNILVPIQSNLENRVENQVEYIVKSGDTLSAIARQYNVSVHQLVQINQIVNANLIYPGQIIIIQQSAIIDYTTNHVIYTVQAGDTLSQIASQFHTTVEEIAALNDISNINLIFVGEKLRVPNG